MDLHRIHLHHFPCHIPSENNRIIIGVPTCQRFFQVVRENRISMGKISSLPASISRISTIFEKLLNPEKLQVGPTASNPGPILLKQAITADRLVVMEKPSMEIKIKLSNIMITYAARYALVFCNIFSSTGCPLERTACTFSGWMTWRTLRRRLLMTRSTRPHLNPPPVLPALAPITMSANRIPLEKAGHRSKSVVA